ncbi:hypothetical protein AVEN_114014-1, partial [Araneus ventricosus]
VSPQPPPDPNPRFATGPVSMLGNYGNPNYNGV